MCSYYSDIHLSTPCYPSSGTNSCTETTQLRWRCCPGLELPQRADPTSKDPPPSGDRATPPHPVPSSYSVSLSSPSQPSSLSPLLLTAPLLVPLLTRRVNP